MSELFTYHAIDDYGLDPFEFRVLHRIARRGDCWESAPQIAQGCKMGKTKAHEVLNTLEACGLIEANPRLGQSTIYRVKPFTEWPTPDAFEFQKAAIANAGKTVAILPKTKAPESSAMPPDDTPLPPSGMAKTLPPDGRPLPLHDTPLPPDGRPLPLRDTESKPMKGTNKNTKKEATAQLNFGQPIAVDQPRPQEKNIPNSPHHRIIAKRVELFGRIPNMGQEAKAAKWMLDEGFTEAQIVEYMAEIAKAAAERGFTPSLALCARQIDGHFKRKSTPVNFTPGTRPGPVTQADINSPRTGKVCL
jgi:hypothetical protein